MMFSDAEAAGAEFVDNGSAPDFFFHKLHDVHVFGPVCQFVPIVFRRTPGGVLYKEPIFFASMLITEVGPAVGLTLEKTGVPPESGALRYMADWALH